MLSRAALAGIWVYQRYVSPRKGYACAYRIAYGGTGCSGYVKAQVQAQGLWAALPDIRARFAACKRAAMALQSDNSAEDRKSRKDRWYDRWDICQCSPVGSGRSNDGGGPCDSCDIGCCSP